MDGRRRALNIFRFFQWAAHSTAQERRNWRHFIGKTRCLFRSDRHFNYLAVWKFEWFFEKKRRNLIRKEGDFQTSLYVSIADDFWLSPPHFEASFQRPSDRAFFICQIYLKKKKQQQQQMKKKKKKKKRNVTWMTRLCWTIIYPFLWLVNTRLGEVIKSNQTGLVVTLQTWNSPERTKKKTGIK